MSATSHSFGPLAERIVGANEALFVPRERGAVERFFSPDYRTHIGEADVQGGHAGVHLYLERLFRAFTEVEVRVEILMESGDRVAWRRTLSGVQTGSYLGFPASARRVVWRDMVVSRLHEEVIAEEWVVTDLAEQLLMARKRPKA
jgi:predicted ester cyclase